MVCPLCPSISNVWFVIQTSVENSGPPKETTKRVASSRVKSRPSSHRLSQSSSFAAKPVTDTPTQGKPSTVQKKAIKDADTSIGFHRSIGRYVHKWSSKAQHLFSINFFLFFCGLSFCSLLRLLLRLLLLKAPERKADPPLEWSSGDVLSNEEIKNMLRTIPWKDMKSNEVFATPRTTWHILTLFEKSKVRPWQVTSMSHDTLWNGMLVSALASAENVDYQHRTSRQATHA